MLIYLENLCCCCSNLVGAVEDLGQSSLEHILDNFDVDNRNCLSSWTNFSCFTEGKAGLSLRKICIKQYSSTYGSRFFIDNISMTFICLQLQQYLQFLEIEFDNVLLERKELQKQFQAALKEHKMMELMLDELEMIHEKATNKIALLESEVMAYLSPVLNVINYIRDGWN
ncbi:uncharacterized protein E5676_scaffold113G00650 [Cucumis melo var. makuwa]|uniref:Uncharacterized protein n=1 Tax=Cucumis melo var. makuwa TaxID=1194695 RepID=A0A5A7UAN7_CUCMM|nr:uncharacterized protein E6C27_scaffold207G00830 [Cucumis melo var. makuwa]TYK01824.1 uncharacterized protein E5676_scaffold113G00650 [Cucumis melo var. makuwa]